MSINVSPRIGKKPSVFVRGVMLAITRSVEKVADDVERDRYINFVAQLKEGFERLPLGSRP